MATRVSRGVGAVTTVLLSFGQTLGGRTSTKHARVRGEWFNVGDVQAAANLNTAQPPNGDTRTGQFALAL